MAIGHPKGLFPLFFTEMWERLAFYTMLGILLLYTTDIERGGLGLPAAEGNEIYGLYLAFVYFTPFIGGMVADRFLGFRKAVLLGGILMAAGLFLMSTPGFGFFTSGLGLVIVGNGFFKPNISVMVGNLYQPGDPKRDAGFNIFYMGINIGAFAANLLAASVRNELGWLWTFRVAGFGICTGLLILLLNWKLLERADRKPERNPDDASFGMIVRNILLPAFGVGILGYFLAKAYLPASIPVRPAVAGFLAGMIPVIIFFVRLGLTAREDEKPGLLALLPIYVAGGTFFMVLHLNGSAMTQWARDSTDRQAALVPAAMKQEAFPQYYLNAGEDTPRPDPRSLLVVDDARVARMYGVQRMDDAAVRAALEADPTVRAVETGEGSQASDIDRRASAVFADGVVEVVEGLDSHGAPQITVEVPDSARPIRQVAFVRTVDGVDIALFVVDRHTYEEIYDGYFRRFGREPEMLPPGTYLQVANSELYQSFNPLFVIAFTPLVVAFFQYLASRGRAVSTARKVFFGLVLTTVSLLVMVVGGLFSDGGTVKVSALWLVAFYAVVTVGELCLSPMGLSLVTKLAPKRLVGLAMGGWFLATAFGNNFSGFFGGIQHLMSPVAFFAVLAGLAAEARRGDSEVRSVRKKFSIFNSQFPPALPVFPGWVGNREINDRS
ncbi:MAG: peptide MFS transporter [Thermoanaerobaculales bacterium]|nr:peptide MFS transporter [Thermoanaerobaculales bacterium]